MACLVHRAQLWNFHVCYFIDPVLPSLSTNQFTVSLCARVCLSLLVGWEVMSCHTEGPEQGFFNLSAASALERKEIWTQATAQMNLKSIMLSGMNQSQKASAV